MAVSKHDLKPSGVFFCEKLHAALVSQVMKKVNFSTQYEFIEFFDLAMKLMYEILLNII